MTFDESSLVGVLVVVMAVALYGMAWAFGGLWKMRKSDR